MYTQLFPSASTPNGSDPKTFMTAISSTASVKDFVYSSWGECCLTS